MRSGIKKSIILIIINLVLTTTVMEQCALCTKTAQQLGEKPAQGLNSGILYLMGIPFVLMGVIGYRWWKNNRHPEGDFENGQ